MFKIETRDVCGDKIQYFAESYEVAKKIAYYLEYFTDEDDVDIVELEVTHIEDIPTPKVVHFEGNLFFNKYMNFTGEFNYFKISPDNVDYDKKEFATNTIDFGPIEVLSYNSNLQAPFYGVIEARENESPEDLDKRIREFIKTSYNEVDENEYSKENETKNE